MDLGGGGGGDGGAAAERDGDGDSSGSLHVDGGARGGTGFFDSQDCCGSSNPVAPESGYPTVAAVAAV
jgi:hypothetical protein